jgi:hypothetical protein
MREFKRFKKVLSCPLCHKAFCSQCLKYTHPEKNVTVCQFCFKHHNRMKKQDDEVMKNFHDRFYKPIQKSQSVDHYRPKANVSSVDGRPSSSRYGFTDDADLELERRLRELKGPVAVPPSEKELKERFEKISESTAGESENHDSEANTAPKTETEETNDLMKQAEEENKLEQKLKEKDGDLSHRLDNLKDREHPTQPSASIPESSGVDGSQPGDEWSKAKEHCKVEQKEIDSLISEAKHLVEGENDLHTRDKDFMAEAQSRLGELNKENKGAVQTEKGAVGSGVGFQFKWTEPDSEFCIADGDPEDSDIQIQKLIEQMVQESKLEEKLENNQIDPHKFRKSEEMPPLQAKVHPQSKSLSQATSLPPQQTVASASKISYPTDELPWCCICNVDAAIMCLDCDNDLYCMRCFKHGHEQFSMFGHRYELYEMPEQLLK